jgi:hypothetical protein
MTKTGVLEALFIAASGNILNENSCTVAEKVWYMASSVHDTTTLVKMLQAPHLPETCLQQARAMNKGEIRIAYLQRHDVPDKFELLITEKRSAVLAQLANLGRNDANILDAIVRQMKDKPTKLLATAVLNSEISDIDIITVCIKHLNKEDASAVRLILFGSARIALKEKKGIVEALNKADKRLLEFVELLDTNNIFDVVELIDIRSVAPSELFELVDYIMGWIYRARLKAESGENVDSYSYNSPFRNIVNLLVDIIKLDGCSDEIIDMLSVKISQEYLFINSAHYGNMPDALYSLLTIIPNYNLSLTLSSRNKEASKASKKQIEKLLFSIEGRSFPQESWFVQDTLSGLLKNKTLLADKQLLARAYRCMGRDAVVRSVAETGDAYIISCLWDANHTMPIACWRFATVAPKLLAKMVSEVVDNHVLQLKGKNVSGEYRDASIIGAPLSNDLLKLLPWNLIERSIWLLDDKKQSINSNLGELIVEQLGSNIAHWECFRTLGENWSGNLGDLLTAAVSL